MRFNALGITHKEGGQMFQFGHHGLLCPQPFPCLPPSQSELQFGNHFLAPGQKGPLRECEQLGYFESQEGRSEEAIQVWRSQGFYCRQSPCLNLETGWAPEWLSIWGVLLDFLPLLGGLAIMKQSATHLQSSLNKN